MSYYNLKGPQHRVVALLIVSKQTASIKKTAFAFAR